MREDLGKSLEADAVAEVGGKVVDMKVKFCKWALDARDDVAEHGEMADDVALALEESATKLLKDAGRALDGCILHEKKAVSFRFSGSYFTLLNSKGSSASRCESLA